MLNINLKELAKSINDVSVTEVNEADSKDIAIIGISAKLPMAEDINGFWENLINGKDCITDLPGVRKAEADSYFKFKGMNPEGIGYKRGSYLDRIDEFDFRYFNLSPREASLMDPNQRLFLEAALGAIEDAGYGGEQLRGSRTGVYCGFVSDLAYQRFIAEVDPSSLGISIPGNMAAVIPGRVSYVLDLKGPSIVMDTACSSSLVAVHTACRGLRNGDCDMAIAGSVKISLLPLEDENMLGIESKSYICRAFDDNSDGTCMGEGVMAIVLKPLSKALRDRDNIYAVIKGSAINQDGASIGITAPNVLAQADVIENAWNDAGVTPETITYIEAHGTGTKLGDPIEIDGITRAFSKYTNRKQFCGVGSVKTNLGHLDSAAGLAGLLKAVLSLKNKKIPPSIHFEKPNRNIDFGNSPVYVNTKLNEWICEEHPRRCGISAFGLSGTNCHIVMEEAPSFEKMDDEGNNAHLFTLSAKSKDALQNLICKYVKALENGIDGTLGDLCFTANTGRGHYALRLAIIVNEIFELKEILSSLNIDNLKTDEEKGIYFGEFKIGNGNKSNGSVFEISETELKNINGIVNSKVTGFKNCEDKPSVLRDICKLYINGASVFWNRLYEACSYRRISIPTYAFDRKRCGIDIPEVSGYCIGQSNKSAEAKVMERNQTYGTAAKVTLKGKSSGVYSETEKAVAEVWGEILGFDELDVNDDFYDLGGDSIIAMNIANTLNNKLNINIKVSELLRCLTISELGVFIDKKLSENTTGATALPAIVPLKEQEYYSLSSAQKRIFLIEQLGNTGASYNIPIAVKIQGHVDVDYLERVFRKIVERHESLRTSFRFVNGEPVQVVQKQFDFKLQYIECDKNELSMVVDNLIQPFDLSKAPLFRVCLVKTAEDEYILFYDTHHIVSDGFSQAILLKDFIKLYQACELPEMIIQYKDYSAWHNSLLETEMMKKQERYWCEKFSGDVPVLDMPLDFRRPENQVFTGSVQEFIVPENTITGLKVLAQKLGTTLNSILLSAYTLLLGKYSRQSEVVVGSLVAGRRHKSLENVIGMFVNFIPIKVHLDDESPVTDFIKSTSSTILEAYENQDCPFDRIIENMTSKLDRTRNPLFDTVFIFHNELKPEENIEIDGMKFSSFELEMKTSKLDFKIDAYPNNQGGLRCVLEYNTRLFKEGSIKDFIRYFELLLEKVSDKPEQAIGSIELFTEDEKRMLEEKRKLNLSLRSAVSLAVSAT
ncbi:MAG: condensation domain-containing protein, partial [Clostridia bacterium]|nr:condensation domain-containing protein [Clostridia bacterium]